jgi:predicted transcriptional regulator
VPAARRGRSIEAPASVRRWADTADVLQNAQMRLLRALQEVHPQSMHDFYGLAAGLIQRE